MKDTSLMLFGIEGLIIYNNIGINLNKLHKNKNQISNLAFLIFFITNCERIE